MEQKNKNLQMLVVFIGLMVVMNLSTAATVISDDPSSFGDEVTIANADLKFSGASADIIHDTQLDIYPNNQLTRAFRIADTGSALVLSALGVTKIDIDDNLNFLAGQSLMSAGNFNIYPNNQATRAFNLIDDGSDITMSVAGDTRIRLNDDLYVNDGMSLELHTTTGDVLGVDPQSIELYGDDPQAKPYLAWKTYYDSNNDGSADTQTWSAWMGAHYNTSLNSDAHQHWSVETFDTDTGSVNTRFEIGYGKPVSDLWVGINAVNYLNLKGGVDLRFTTGNVEKARIDVADATNHMNISTQGNGDILFDTGGSGDMEFHTDDVSFANANSISLGGTDLFSSTKIDLFPNAQTARSFTAEDTGAQMTIKVYGANELRIDENDVMVTGVSSDGAGSVVCIKANGAFGTCTDAPGVTGDCTCV